MSNILVTSPCWEEKEWGNELCDCQGVLPVTHGVALYVEDAKISTRRLEIHLWRYRGVDAQCFGARFFLSHRLPKCLCTFLLPGEPETWSSLSFVV